MNHETPAAPGTHATPRRQVLQARSTAPIRRSCLEIFQREVHR